MQDLPVILINDNFLNKIRRIFSVMVYVICSLQQ